MNLELEEIKSKNVNNNRLFLIARSLMVFSILEWLWYALLAFSKSIFFAEYNKGYCENISENLYSSSFIMERMMDKYYGSIYLITIILLIVFALYLVFMITNYRLSKRKSPYLRKLLMIEIIVLLVVIVVPCILFFTSIT